jgi:PAS domain S-box-containing protein
MGPAESSELHRRRTVGILVFDDVEVLDFCGPFEVFFAARLDGQTDDDPPLFEIVTIAEERRLVRCSGGLQVLPAHTFEDHPPLDILVLPGGDGRVREVHNSSLLEWIRRRDGCTEITMGVCTGAFLLAASGILNGLEATSHRDRVDLLRDHYPAVDVLNNVRLVDTGHVLTSAGISAGTDLALHVVERLHGERAATWTARRMEHLWSQQYRNIFEASADAILIVELQGRIVEANTTACRMFGRVRERMVGMLAADLAPPPHRDEIAAHFQSVPAELRSVGRREDGELFHAELHSTPFEYRGLSHVLSMIRDITARVEAEEAVRKERERLSRDLHDSVSQALFGIALGAKTARAQLGDGESPLAGSLDFVIEQAARGLAEMRALIFELRPEALEQEGLVAALARRAAALEAQYQLRLEPALGDEPEVAFAVKEALYRIAQEAMQNAVKHAQATELGLSLGCSDDTITLEIRDNGKGFDPTGSFPGHLGLQSMRERASQLGGTLELKSAAGAGTSITVRMPCMRA